MPKEFRVMTDTYVRPDSYLEALKDYDAQMREYYDLRNKGKREDKFTNQIFQNLGKVRNRRASILDDIESQGFLMHP